MVNTARYRFTKEGTFFPFFFWLVLQSSNKIHLMRLEIFPLMMYYKLIGVMLFVKSIKSPTDHFDINKFISFSSTNSRCSTNYKLIHFLSTSNYAKNFCFNRCPRLWNSPPVFDPSQSVTSNKQKLLKFLFDHIVIHFYPNIVCTYRYLSPCRCSVHPPTPPFH